LGASLQHFAGSREQHQAITFMKIGVVILAAGRGTRLNPVTENLPKCLVPVAGKPLLLHMIESLELAQKENGAAVTLHLVTGFQADAIESFLSARRNAIGVRIVSNADYATTNNLYSLQLALRDVRDGGYDRLVWANGDCIYDPAIVARALDAGPSAILCDSRYPYNEESMKILVEDGSIQAIGKNIPPGPGRFVSIDCYRLEPECRTRFDHFIETYCVGPRRNIWAELALHDFMQVEREKGSAGIRLAPLDIEGLRWAEIDNANDWALAEKLWETDAAKRQA
jgi:choline kinase